MESPLRMLRIIRDPFHFRLPLGLGLGLGLGLESGIRVPRWMPRLSPKKWIGGRDSRIDGGQGRPEPPEIRVGVRVRVRVGVRVRARTRDLNAFSDVDGDLKMAQD